MGRETAGTVRVGSGEGVKDGSGEEPGGGTGEVANALGEEVTVVGRRVLGVEVVAEVGGISGRGGEGGGKRAGLSLSIDTEVSPCGNSSTKYFGSRRITLNGP